MSQLNGLYYATAINNSGEVAGYIPLGGAIVYNEGTLTRLSSLAGTFSYATGINNSGQVVGSDDFTGGAFLYSGGVLPGWAHSAVYTALRPGSMTRER
jgi:probable HAF family extracellular repeat protein